MNKISDNKIFTTESSAVVFHNAGIAWQPFANHGFRNVGVERVVKSFQTAWLKNDYGLVFIIEKGDYVFRSADAELQFGAGQAVIVPPGVMRQIRLLDREGKHMFIHIQDTDKWSGLFNNPGINKLNSSEELFKLASLFVQEVSSSTHNSLQIAAKLAEAFIMCLQRESDLKLTTFELKQQEKMNLLWRDVAAIPESKWTVPDMAKRLCFSVGHFHYLCKKLNGISPMDKVIAIRMEKACVLLLNTDDPLPDIAETVGYESVYSFSRLFKKHIGTSPGKYRKG